MKTGVKVGIFYMPIEGAVDVVTMARTVEALGFESLWVPDHPVMPVRRSTPFPGGGEMPAYYGQIADPFITLAAAASVTERIRLGTGIVLVPERQPLVMAKEVATLDQVADGRLELGIGAGWLREEGELLGTDWPRRWTQTGEYLAAMKACWQQEISEFHGRYVDFPPLYSHPKPRQKPHPPVLIAGELEGSVERVIAYGDGWIPRYVSTSAEDITQKRRRFENGFHEAGRDFGSFSISLFGCAAERAVHRRFADAGVDRILQILRPRPPTETLKCLERWAEELL